VLSAETVPAYSPIPKPISRAALLGLQPSEVMMVAAHKDDLQAANVAGSYRFRAPAMEGNGCESRSVAGPLLRFQCDDFNDLASQLERKAPDESTGFSKVLRPRPRPPSGLPLRVFHWCWCCW